MTYSSGPRQHHFFICLCGCQYVRAVCVRLCWLGDVISLVSSSWYLNNVESSFACVNALFVSVCVRVCVWVYCLCFTRMKIRSTELDRIESNWARISKAEYYKVNALWVKSLTVNRRVLLHCSRNTQAYASALTADKWVDSTLSPVYLCLHLILCVCQYV